MERYCDAVCFLGAIVWLVKAVVMESTMRSLQPLRTRNHGESDQLAFCIGFLLKNVCLYGKEKLKIFMKIVKKKTPALEMYFLVPGCQERHPLTNLKYKKDHRGIGYLAIVDLELGPSRSTLNIS